MSAELSAKAACARPVASVPRHLICAACPDRLLINCFQTHSGFRLCQECVRSKLHPTNPTQCPGSCDQDDEAERMTSQATCLPDLATRLELSQLQVHCPNAEAGCEAQMIWKYVMQHLDENCEKEVAKCPQCSQEVVLYKLRSSHRDLRSAECCPYHVSNCCPLCQDSSRSLDPSAFAEHEKTCPAKEAACKYACVGCGRIMQRSQLSQHYSDSVDEHLEQTLRQKDQQIKEQHELIVKLQARLDDIETRGIPMPGSRKDQSSQVHKSSFDAMEARMMLMEDNLKSLELKFKHFENQQLQAATSSLGRLSPSVRHRNQSLNDTSHRQHKPVTPNMPSIETINRRNSEFLVAAAQTQEDRRRMRSIS